MLTIHKLRDDLTIGFAAEELKKYLLMMMPETAMIPVDMDTAATDGFRLGLLEDFGIEAGDIDPVMDDIVHVDTTECGGILAGSNPRSVLFAVYRFLRLNGCRFLFPGAEGERIPQKKITPQKYHKLADHKIRGRTIEGRPSLEQVLVSLDFYAKGEINAFGCYGVSRYHYNYYRHNFNKANREAEFFDHAQADTQWRALYETEAQKRGMMVFSGEHEMVPHALGISESDRALYKSGEKKLTEEQISCLAMINGERKLLRDDILYTNLCMSQPALREKMARAVVHEIESKPQLTMFGCTVADLSNNHCECEECQKKIPSDWYVMILNRIDELLTEKGIDTKVVFAFYVDMIFAPETVKLNNPDRFCLMYCPISRTYTESLREDTVYPTELPKYVRNNWEAPTDQETMMALLKKWKDVFPGSCYAFEYHYYMHQFHDPGMQVFGRRIYEDVRSYQFTDMCGCMEDGSNKSFWPNGFHTHIYHEAMVNRDCDYEEEFADFYRSQYGENWQAARAYLQEITDAFDHKYMCGEKYPDWKMGIYYNPDHVASLSTVAEITERFLAYKKTVQPTHRVEYLGWQLLAYHAKFCAGLAKVLITKCQGDTEKALEELEAFYADFGKDEVLLERWFDFGAAAGTYKRLVKTDKPTVAF